MAFFTRSISDLIAEGFDFGLEPSDYPIFDESYRDDLNTKILRHYWNYEIGHETESMFRFSLNRKMNEIMPYYNQLYLSTKIAFDPLSTMNYGNVTDGTGHVAGTSHDDDTGTTNRTEDSTSNASNSTETDSSSRGVHSDFPQNALSGDQDYASNMNDATAKTTATGSQDSSGHTTGTDTLSRTNDGTTSEDSTTHASTTVQGYQGVASELLMTYRKSLLNIDLQVIYDLRSLFMGLWSAGDAFSGYSNGYVGYPWIW